MRRAYTPSRPSSSIRQRERLISAGYKGAGNASRSFIANLLGPPGKRMAETLHPRIAGRLGTQLQFLQLLKRPVVEFFGPRYHG